MGRWESYQKLNLDLLFTYGAVERIRYILRANVFANYEAPNLESLLSELCAAFPKIYKKFTGYQISHTLNDDLSTFIPDDNLSMFTTTDDDLSRLSMDTDDDHPPSTFIPDDDDNFGRLKMIGDWIRRLRNIAHGIEGTIMEVAAIRQLEVQRSIADSGYELRKLISELEDIYHILDASDSKEDEVGAKESETDNLFIPPAFLSNTTKATGTSYQSCSWEDTIIGRQPERKLIVEWIFNPSKHPNIISVSGIGGIGKTTLAKMVYNDVQVSTRFDLVSWSVTVSLDIKSTIVEIVRSFTGQSRYYLQRMDTETLKVRLLNVLKGQKYLLVLDNIRMGQLFGFEELREILEAGLPGSTVILITHIDCWYVLEGKSYARNYILECLPANDCWSLFSRCAGFDEEAEKEFPFLMSIGRSIVNKCDGCPQAIKTLGILLRSIRDEHSWKQIDESKTWSTFAPYTTSAALTISLENMPCEMVQCFVPLVLPKVMSRDQLVYFWMAQWLLYSREGIEDPIATVDGYCNELLSMSYLQLIQRNGEDFVLLLDQAKNLLLDMLREEVSLLSGASFPDNCRHLIWNGHKSSLDKGFAPDNLTLPNARTFLFQEYVGPVKKPFLEGIMSKLKHAHVLFLDGSEFEELPETIGNLKLLRYLSLAGNHKLKALPESTCKLVSLMTLDLSGCEQLERLPKQMQKLASLRHLFLTVKLTSVLEKALKSWSSLHHLKICCSPNLKSISARIAQLSALRVLQIHDCPSITSLPDNIKLLPYLQELSILNCTNLDLTKWGGLYGLRRLRLVQFHGLPKLRQFPKELQSAGDSLRRLIVGNCRNLTGLPECLQSCIHLSEIVIYNCPLMGSLPKGIHGLNTLQVLKIVNCPDLVARCQMGIGEDWHLVSHIPKIQLQHQVIQNRATSPLKERPDALYDRREPGKEGDEVNEVDCARASTSFQEVRRHSVKKIVMKVDINSYKGEMQILKKVASIEGVYKITVDRDKRTLTIVGTVYPAPIFNALRKIKKNPEILTVGPLRSLSCDEISLDKHEDKMKEIECSTTGTIVQKDEDLLQEDSVVEKGIKDRCSILCLLPESYEIEKETLIQLWMAGENITDEPMELKGEEYFSFVLQNGYLLRSGANFMTGKDKYRINIKKINELLVDDQNFIGSFYLILENESQKNNKPTKSIQHVSLVGNDIDHATTFQTLQKFSELRTLLFLGNHGHRVRDIPDQLFSSFENLQALDLSRTHIWELPSSVGNMIHLRYLDLSWTLIEWLPDTICSLAELQTLKLRGCPNLRELPSQLQRLTTLRHLDIDVLRQLEAMPKGIGVLVNLRTLSGFLVGTEDGCRIQELKELNNLAGNFCIAKLENVENVDEAREATLYKKDRVEKLELRWTASELAGTHNKSDAILECLQPCTSLEELRIICYEGSTFPSWISNPGFNKLASIILYRCENVSEIPPIEQLPSLKHLELVKMNSVERIGFREKQKKSVAFPKLEKLDINEMQSLKVWDWKNGNEGDFISLTQLNINECPELLEFDVLTYLSTLKHFEIRECPKLQSLSDVKLPDSLEELIVEDCPQIQKKCSEREGVDWYKIEHVPNKRIQEVDTDEDDS